MRLETVWLSFEARFVENPAYLSVIVRWITCAVAAIAVVFRAVPPENLRNAVLALVFVVTWCVALTLGPFVQPRKPLVRTAVLGVAADILFSCWIIYITGGFRTPFYEFGLTSVIAPSLLFRMRGAIFSGVAFCGLFFLAVNASGPGFQAVIREGVVDGTLFSSVTNPFTIGIFCALLGTVLERLHEARERARVFAALEERSRIAREIHDGIAQRIFMLTLNLETCAELARRAIDPENVSNLQRIADLGGRLETLMQMSKEALLEVRHYIFDVKPLLEGDETLCESLRGQVREFEAVSGIRVRLDSEGDERTLTVPIKIALFRIVQEALANSYKHAKTSEVKVRIRFDEDDVSATIEDTGQGFVPTFGASRGGHGLNGMRRRAEDAGGQFSIASAPGEGTCVEVRMPYERVDATGRERHS